MNNLKQVSCGFFPEAIDRLPLSVRNQVIIGERYRRLEREEAPEGVQLTYLLVKSLTLLTFDEFGRVAPYLFAYDRSSNRQRPLVERLQGTLEEYDLLKENGPGLFGLELEP